MRSDPDLVRLNMVPGMTPRAAVVLLDAYGAAGRVLRARSEEAGTLRDIPPALVRGLADPPSEGEVRRELRRAERRGIEVLHPEGPDYPERLREIPDPPICLYVLGEVRSAEDGVAVVGARRASVYGRLHAERFGRGLAAAGPLVVSGLARGVDGAAHRGALDVGGRTAAVLGSGLDRIYPPEHKGLFAEIAARGYVCSEHPFGRPPLARHFPMRNRIVAGLASAVVIVEGRIRSGSLITARLAGEFGRIVFALPGRVDTDLARAPHALIRDGAILAEGPDQVLEDLGYRPIEAEPTPPPPEEPLQRRILALLDPSEPVGVEAILDGADGTAPAVLAALTALELSGRAREVEGRRYVKAR